MMKKMQTTIEINETKAINQNDVGGLNYKPLMGEIVKDKDYDGTYITKDDKSIFLMMKIRCQRCDTPLMDYKGNLRFERVGMGYNHIVYCEECKIVMAVNDGMQSSKISPYTFGWR